MDTGGTPYEQILREFIAAAGYRADVERVRAGGFRVTARDDAGHVQIVTADNEYEALVELAERLGFDLEE